MISIVFILVTLVAGIKSCGDFYWRDYEGVIPSDAIPAGENVNGLSYIGQAYIHEYGLLLGTIIPGERVINVPCYGVKKGVIIKILCAQNTRKYYWLATTKDTYAQDTSNKCPVLGGYDQKQKQTLGTLHIGRTWKDRQAIIGNIGAYRVPDPFFHYPLNNAEIRATEYEVLIYNEYPLLSPQQNNISAIPRLN